MGNQLFGINIGQILASEMGGLLLDASFTSQGPMDVVDINDPLADDRSSVEPTAYTGKGFTEEYNNFLIDGTNIKRGDRKVVLLADTFTAGHPIPADGNLITIEGSTYTIIGDVRRDPAAATYTCQVRL